MRNREHSGGMSVLLAAMTVGALSCGPIIENAPFSVRPDTIQIGNLLGPFDGTVVDAETDRPISGATVFGGWGFERGVGLRGPAGSREFSVETSADGRYQIPRPDDFPTGGSMRLRRFTLVVYRRGYIGYRSDFKFVGGAARHDFSQHANKVRLEKWQNTLEHRRHLAYLGGGQAIVKAAGWEVQPASLEYEGVSAVGMKESPTETAAVVSTRMLDVSPLLSVEEVRGVTGFAGEFEVGRLMDRVRSDVYDSRHFRAKGKSSEAFDVGVRVWATDPEGAQAQFRRLKGELPASVTTEEIGDRSIRAHGGEVWGLAFLLREKGVVVQMSCGTSQCTETGMILRLAKLVESHMGELRLPTENPAPAPGAQDQGKP